MPGGGGGAHLLGEALAVVFALGDDQESYAIAISTPRPARSSGTMPCKQSPGVKHAMKVCHPECVSTAALGLDDLEQIDDDLTLE
jgi:hypothetical protein